MGKAQIFFTSSKHALHSIRVCGAVVTESAGPASGAPIDVLINMVKPAGGPFVDLINKFKEEFICKESPLIEITGLHKLSIQIKKHSGTATEDLDFIRKAFADVKANVLQQPPKHGNYNVSDIVSNPRFNEYRCQECVIDETTDANYSFFSFLCFDKNAIEMLLNGIQSHFSITEEQKTSLFTARDIRAKKPVIFSNMEVKNNDKVSEATSSTEATSVKRQKLS